MSAGIPRRIRPSGDVAAGPGGGTPNGGSMPSSVNQAAGSWSPTVANLLVLVVVELAAFAAIRYLFKRVT